MSLSKFKKTFQLVCLGGQTRNFPEGFSSGKDNIPILPYGTMAKLVVKYYHDRFHKEPDTIIAHVRQDVWIIKARKIAATLDQMCRICLK